MYYLSNTYELLTGGFYSGNNSWSKKHTEIDNCFKIYQLTDGEVDITGGNIDYKLEAGKTYLINGFKLQKQFCNHSFSTHWLHFIPKNLIWYLRLQSLPCVVEITTNHINDKIDSLIQTIKATQGVSLTEYAKASLHLQNLIENSIIDVCERYPVKKDELGSAEMRIELAVLYINSHYKETIKLEYLAQLCNMSVPYFHRLFKQAIKATPANYQTFLKMNDALHQLANLNNSVKEIALNLGFTDTAHFCKTFKRYYGMTPSTYREERKDLVF